MHNPKFFPDFLGGKAYLGAWYEGDAEFEKFSRFNYHQSLTAGAIAETPLGPIFIGSSLNEDGRDRFYFSFGRVFK